MGVTRGRIPRSRSSLLSLSLRDWRINMGDAYIADQHGSKPVSLPHNPVGKKQTADAGGRASGKENTTARILQAKTQGASLDPSHWPELPSQHVQPPQIDGDDSTTKHAEDQSAADLHLSGSEIDILLAADDNIVGQTIAASPPSPPSAHLVWVDCFFYGFWLDESKVANYRDSMAHPGPSAQQR